MKNLIIIFTLFLSIAGYCQNLKGSFKYGGEYQNGEPFKVTFRSIMFGKLEGKNLKTGMPVYDEFIVFFNFKNENKIKIVFPDGQHSIIHNINNIVKTSYRQEAEGGNQVGPPYNNMTVNFYNDNRELTIIDNTTRDVIRLTVPK